MASGSSGRVNSGSQGFDFGSDDILCSYDDFTSQERVNGTHSDSVIGANSNKDCHKSRMARSSFVPAPIYNQPDDSLSQEVINAVERSMKKNSDNILRFLEGISSRLSQLELYCYNVDKSIGEMRSELVRDHEEVDLKLKTLEKHIGEVHRSVQILRDKQELAETHKELAKLQLAQKESANSSQTQQNEERPPTPAIESQKIRDSSDLHNQHLALALPHQIPPSQPSLPPRTMEPSRPAVPPAQPQPQNIPQQQQYYLPPTQMPAQAQPPQGQGQYGTSDSQHQQAQLQDMSRVPPQPLPTNVSQTPPPSQAHQFPQYQQQWPQQLSQQQLQTTPQAPTQPQQQPPNPTHIRPHSGPVYPSYQTSQPASPAPADTIPSSMSMQMQFSGVAQPGMSRGEAVPYGYGGRPIQPQPPPQQLKGNFGAQPNDGYTNMGSHPAPAPASGYMMYGNEEGRPHPPPPQPHFSQGAYPPAPQIPMARNPNQSQFVRNHPYNDLVEKLVNMGFRGEHVINVIQIMENSGQPIDFNAVLDRLSAQSSGSSHRGWSG
uniref:DUF1421 domain-containing protein n=1 Tax=Kalanchoe fedtschenkoi TaxID=63787 RepID=A0A7N0TJU4_KALFE